MTSPADLILTNMEAQVLFLFMFIPEVLIFLICLQVALLASLLPTLFAYVSNPVPDSSLCRESCCSPIVSASAAAPRSIALIRFNCCSPLASASAATLDCVHFNCSLIASASPAAPRLCPLQLLFLDCVHFGCCSPIASALAAAP